MPDHSNFFSAAAALATIEQLDGDAGYQRWADREPDPEVQRLLRRNGREETVHGQRVTEVIAILEGRTGR